jgi:hypothetical protein
LFNNFRLLKLSWDGKCKSGVMDCLQKLMRRLRPVSRAAIRVYGTAIILGIIVFKFILRIILFKFIMSVIIIMVIMVNMVIMMIILLQGRWHN